MDFLPIGIRIRDKKILIVGGGRVATHKATVLSRFTDHATVIAPAVCAEIKALPFSWEERPFSEQDLEDADILFVCTDDKELNHRIKALAEKRRILTSVCDDTAYCDFISPAICRQKADYLTIAVSSDARDVKRSIRVRNRINALIQSGALNIE